MNRVLGKLYIISTPIGNLGDITYRAIDTLKNVDYLLSEDTRETDKILKKYAIKKSQIPYTDQKHEKLYLKILNDLKNGKNIALLTDSGTPLVSDPGFKLVNQLTKEGINIISIPGSTAFVSAMTVSGLPLDKIVFIGFLPKTKSKRENILNEYGNLDATLILYESSHRIKGLLEEIYNILGDRIICVAKDLTKKFENVQTNSISCFIENGHLIKEKGEFVVLVAKKDFTLDE